MMRNTIFIALFVACVPSIARPVQRATLDDFERASAIVVGRLQEVRRLDPYSYTARLRVERVLEGVAPGPPMRLLWEQALATRPPNFYDGDDVLVAVNALTPGGGTDAALPSDALGVAFEIAAGGEAYVRLPDPQSFYLLTSYLSLPPAKRFATLGVTALVRLIASASLRLREAALDRLATIDDLATKISPDAREMLLLLISDADQPLTIRRRVLALIGRRKLKQLGAGLVSLLRVRSTVEPDVLDAMAELEGGLSVDLVERSLEDGDPAVRAAAVRGAPAGPFEDRLAGILRSDPAPLVRAEAARTLARRGGVARLRVAAEGLWDADVVVRSAAARAIGQRGAVAITLLRRAAWSGFGAAAEAAVLGLAVSAAAGAPVLREIVAEHPVAKMRKLAWLAILRF